MSILAAKAFLGGASEVDAVGALVGCAANASGPGRAIKVEVK